MALGWQELTSSQRTSYLQEYNAAGISVIVSAFGSTEQPTTSGTNAVTVADNLASWVKQYGIQGVDIDYEVQSLFLGGMGWTNVYFWNARTSLRLTAPQVPRSRGSSP